jgi:hypothetical protein
MRRIIIASLLLLSACNAHEAFYVSPCHPDVGHTRESEGHTPGCEEEWTSKR